MNIEHAGIAQEKPVFFDTTDQNESTKKEFWKRKEETRNAIPNDPPFITVSFYYANDLHKETTFVNKAQLTKPSRILIEQDPDPLLLNSKREMLGLPFDRRVLINDESYIQYSRNKKRNILQDDILCYYDTMIWEKLVT